MPSDSAYRKLLKSEAKTRAALERASRESSFRFARQRGAGPRSKRLRESTREIEAAVRLGRATSRAAGFLDAEAALRAIARRKGVDLKPLRMPGATALDAKRAARCGRSLANLWDKSYARALGEGKTATQARTFAARRVSARARTIAATENAHAFNEARDKSLRELARDNPKIKQLVEKQWTVNSSNPCSICSELHEERVPIDRDFAESCPAHPCCRCVIEIVEKE